MEESLSFTSLSKFKGPLFSVILKHTRLHTHTHAQTHTDTLVWVHGNFNNGRKNPETRGNISISFYTEPHESGDERER